MSDLIREAPLGMALRWLFRNKILQYPEECSDFNLPIQYLTKITSEKQVPPRVPISAVPSGYSSLTTAQDDSGLESLTMSKTKSRMDTIPFSEEHCEIEQQLEIECAKSLPIMPKQTADGIILVDWYTTDDPANPQNWSRAKCAFVAFVMCAYTWAAYGGSSRYAASESGVMEYFDVNPTEVSLAVSRYFVCNCQFYPCQEIKTAACFPSFKFLWNGNLEVTNSCYLGRITICSLCACIWNRTPPICTSQRNSHHWTKSSLLHNIYPILYHFIPHGSCHQFCQSIGFALPPRIFQQPRIG